MKLFWLIIAGAASAVAAAFLLRGDFETAFILAVVGIIAWFLNYRMQIKAALAAQQSGEEQSDGDGGEKSSESNP